MKINLKTSIKSTKGTNIGLKIAESLIIKNKEKQSFSSLSPTQNARNSAPYIDSIKWALKNRRKQDIKNIAISGPFGSGKSSIIKTFQKKIKLRGIKYLTISLARFNEIQKHEIKEGDFNNQTNDQSTTTKQPTTSETISTRLIELSILQQLFYFEKDNKIPDSRFRKIKRFSSSNLILKTLGAILVLFSIVFLISSEFSNSLLKYVEPFFDKIEMQIFAILIILIGITIFIFNSIRFIHNVKISKFKIKNAEIEVNNNLDKSILNHHLDEILYFFEVTNYNVVIIEDLDRYKNIEIFGKLREINHLINNSRKVNKHIVFIYAINDAIFKGEDRTKFFDFFIPIIPIINSSNSNELLLEKKHKLNLDITPNVIEDLSLFVSDLRLLHNITNEYIIYHNSLDKNLKQDNLFAIILYKNLFPDDFNDLLKNEGEIFKELISKSDKTKALIEKNQNRIESLKSENDLLKSLQIKSIAELRILYIYTYIKDIPDFHSFVQPNGSLLPSDQMLTDNNFNLLRNGHIKQFKTTRNYNSFHKESFNKRFADIEEIVDPEKSYLEREELINKYNSNRINENELEIQKLKIENNDYNSKPLQNFIVKEKIPNIDENNKQRVLINQLLANGYVDEDYHDYISIFFEGSITKEDRIFLLNIKNGIALDYDYNLTNIDNIIKKLSAPDFTGKSILNYELVSRVFESDKYKDYQDKIISLLSNESKDSIHFLNYYIVNYQQTAKKLIKLLCENWDSIWRYISKYTNTDKELYLFLILTNTNISTLKNIANNSDIIEFITNKRNFDRYIEHTDKLMEIIGEFEIKISDLSQIKNIDLFYYIYNGHYYKINLTNTELIALKENVNNSFYYSNYHSILTSNLNDLKSYIEDNINLYIENVYLKLKDNKKEAEEELIVLLNNKKLSSDNKEKIIIQVETKIDDLTQIADKDICKILFEHEKVETRYTNIIHYYRLNDRIIDSTIIDLLNDPQKTEILSTHQIPEDEKGNTDEDSSDKNLHLKFSTDLIHCGEIEIERFADIAKSISYCFNFPNYEKISEEKALILIKNKVFDIDNDFNELKKHYDKVHIELIKHNFEDFLESDIVNELDFNDITYIILSTDIDKAAFVNALSDEFQNNLFVNLDAINAIFESIIVGKNIGYSKSFVLTIILNTSINDEIRLKVFNVYKSSFEIGEVTDFLNSLQGKYPQLTKPLKRPKLKNTKDNRDLLSYLESKNYIKHYTVKKNTIEVSVPKSKLVF
jgi:hypothetical protein